MKSNNDNTSHHPLSRVPHLLSPQPEGLPPERLLDLYYYLRLPRAIEERMLILLRQGKIAKWFSGIGQEAISVGATFAVNQDDVLFTMHRNLGVFTTRNVDLARLFRQIMGKEGGFTKGRDRSFHFGAPEYNIIGMISHLGAMLPVADGVALAFQLRNERRVVLSFTGDGSTSEGDFHEAVNLAAVWKLPVVFVIENNGYGLSTPTHEQFVCERLADKGVGYGIEGVRIDGNDVLAVYHTIRKATEKARRGEGPTLIEAVTFRMRGHEEASGTKYIPNELFDEWAKHDPIALFEDYLTSMGLFSEAMKTLVTQRARDAFAEALDDALHAQHASTTAERELNDVYAPSDSASQIATGTRSTMRFVDSIRHTLEHAMERDERVLIMGQDVAEYGGVFKVTEGFVQKFSRARVRNTPIIESGIIGAGMGLALEGFKPIVEMQFADFVACGFNQIVNNLAKTHYRWGASVNVTIRLPSGGGTNSGPFHSQSPEAWFFHVPGLKLVMPSTPHDAKGLLAASIEDPNPVLFFEHKALYRSIKGDVPDEWFTIAIGEADVKRTGSDMTIITYGLGVHWALELAETLSHEGAEIEVVDLRSLLPWDRETVLESVRKTNRVLVLHEANLTGGIGAEIAATISQEAFEHLDAPVTRAGSLDIPIPFSDAFEKHIYWPKDKLPQIARDVLAY